MESDFSENFEDKVIKSKLKSIEQAHTNAVLYILQHFLPLFSYMSVSGQGDQTDLQKYPSTVNRIIAVNKILKENESQKKIDFVNFLSHLSSLIPSNPFLDRVGFFSGLKNYEYLREFEITNFHLLTIRKEPLFITSLLRVKLGNVINLSFLPDTFGTNMKEEIKLIDYVVHILPKDFMIKKFFKAKNISLDDLEVKNGIQKIEVFSEYDDFKVFEKLFHTLMKHIYRIEDKVFRTNNKEKNYDQCFEEYKKLLLQITERIKIDIPDKEKVYFDLENALIEFIFYLDKFLNLGGCRKNTFSEIENEFGELLGYLIAQNFTSAQDFYESDKNEIGEKLLGRLIQKLFINRNNDFYENKTVRNNIKQEETKIVIRKKGKPKLVKREYNEIKLFDIKNDLIYLLEEKSLESKKSKRILGSLFKALLGIHFKYSETDETSPYSNILLRYFFRNSFLGSFKCSIVMELLKDSVLIFFSDIFSVEIETRTEYIKKYSSLFFHIEKIIRWETEKDEINNV